MFKSQNLIILYVQCACMACFVAEPHCTIHPITLSGNTTPSRTHCPYYRRSIAAFGMKNAGDNPARSRSRTVRILGCRSLDVEHGTST